ncbi:MAG: glycosyltransferase family 4 protein, partial [Pseudomonadota bacterium]
MDEYRRRIALCTELYPPSIGGQEIRFEALAKNFAARGWSVSVLCIQHEPSVPLNERRGRIDVRRMACKGGYRNPPMKWMRRRWDVIGRYAFWMNRHLREIDPELIILNQWPLLHAAALSAPQRAHAVIDWCEVRTSPFYRSVQAALPKRVKHNIAVSNGVAAAIKEASGRDVHVAPSGIDADQYRAKPRRDRSGLLYFGRVAPHKNVEFLIDSFETLCTDGYAGRLTVAGEGPSLDSVRTRAAASREAARIDVLGRIDE